MEIVLRETIEKLGAAGEVVRVRPGYARNYLLPKKLAYRATPGNLKVIAQERQKMLRRDAERRGAAEKIAEAIGQLELSFARRVGEHEALYGSVTSSDIAEALEQQGFAIDRRKIVLGDHIKRLGEFVVPIRLFPEVVAELKLRVVAQGAGSAAAPVSAAEAGEPAGADTDDTDEAAGPE
jgi:large subunit ribosomal protein L9